MKKIETMKKIIFTLIILNTIVLASCNNSANNEAHQGEHAEGEHQSVTQPKEESGHTEEVHVTPEQKQEMGIVVKPLKGGTVNSEIQRPAQVIFNPDKTVKVGPRISSKVEKVQVDLGQRVSKGEALAYMSSVELGKIKAEYLSLLSRYHTKQKAYKREKKLYEEQISSESDYLEAKAEFENTKAELESSRENLELYGISAERVGDNEHPLSYFTIRSPISGIVQERNLSPGETLSPQSTPVHVVNNREMWVMIDAYEKDNAAIQTGQKISLSVKSLPGKRFEGTIDWISDALDEDTRTLKSRAIVNNLQGLLKSGMYGTASIINDKKSDTPIIPVDAVQTINNEKYVFIPAEEDGSFTTVQVTTGKENNGWVEIAGNVNIGEPVVVEGAFNLKSALTSKTRSAAHSH